jgi:hypothetical protein
MDTPLKTGKKRKGRLPAAQNRKREAQGEVLEAEYLFLN